MQETNERGIARRNSSYATQELAFHARPVRQACFKMPDTMQQPRSLLSFFVALRSLFPVRHAGYMNDDDA